MQAHLFSNGGYVGHKLTLSESPMKFSAWFDASGALIDASAIDKAGRERNATEGQRKALARQAGIVAIAAGKPASAL